MRIINLWEHTGWGNSVYFSDYKARRITGWLSILPEVGDEIRIGMEFNGNGKRYKRFLITSIERCNEPQDMFFCDVKDKGEIFVNGDSEFIFGIKEPCPICKRKKKTYQKLIDHISNKHPELLKEIK